MHTLFRTFIAEYKERKKGNCKQEEKENLKLDSLISLKIDVNYYTLVGGLPQWEKDSWGMFEENSQRDCAWKFRGKSYAKTAQFPIIIYAI